MKKIYQILSSCSVMVIGFQSMAMATAWDGYADIATAVNTELVAALGVVAAILALTIGVPMGVRLFRRIAR